VGYRQGREEYRNPRQTENMPKEVRVAVNKKGVGHAVRGQAKKPKKSKWKEGGNSMGTRIPGLGKRSDKERILAKKKKQRTNAG